MLVTLLFLVKGTEIFADISVVKGVHCRNFLDVCEAWDLLKDAAECVRALAEPSKYTLGPFTHLFSTVLANCNPSRPQDQLKDYCNMFTTYICTVSASVSSYFGTVQVH